MIKVLHRDFSDCQGRLLSRALKIPFELLNIGEAMTMQVILEFQINPNGA